MLSRGHTFPCNTSEAACHVDLVAIMRAAFDHWTLTPSPWLCQAPAPWSSPYYSLFAKEVTEPPGEVGSRPKAICLVWDRDKIWTSVNGSPKSTLLPCGLFISHFKKEVEDEAMAPHSSVLAWRIPGMGEPGGLPSTGSHRVGHDWSDLSAVAAAAEDENVCVPMRTFAELICAGTQQQPCWSIVVESNNQRGPLWAAGNMA